MDADDYHLPSRKDDEMIRIYTESGSLAGAARTMAEALEMKARMERAQRYTKYCKHKFTIVAK